MTAQSQDPKVIDFIQSSANATREYYLNWGWQLTPVKFKGKAPIMSKWNTHVLDYEAFIGEYGNTPHNLGLILGKKQVDIDLDRPEARALAPLLLPPTRRFGRKSAPNSHYIYDLAPSFEEKGVKSRKWSLPASLVDADKAVIVELRGNSAQTVVPPSIHTSGESIKWHGFSEGVWEDDFRRLDDLELIVSACDTMAFLTLMSVVWAQMDGNRHDLALATTGLLLKSGTNIDPEAVYDMMDWVMTTAGDEEKPARLRNEVNGTIDRWKNGDLTQGYKRLAELLPADVMVSIKNWITEGAYTVPKFNEMTYHDLDAIGDVHVSESHPYLVYVADEDGYRDAKLGTKYTSGTALSRTFGRTLGKKATKIIEQRAPQVTARAYMPARNVIDRGEVFNSETGSYVGETTCLNTWVGTHVIPAQGDAESFRLHVSSLVDYDEELTRHLLDWIAFTVQKPREKTAWAILMMHGQGTGKTSLGNLIGKLVGESNYSTPDSNAVNSQFNNWLIDTRFILMDEIKSANNKWDLLDRLKPLITDTTVSVNIKGGAQKFQRNYCQIWMNTNHAFPMAVSEGDRRLFIFKSKTIYMSRAQIQEHIEPWYKGGEYFKWSESKEGLGLILGFLMDRDLSDFNPHANAPMTASRAELVADSSSDIEDWLTEAYHLKQAPLKADIIRYSDVVKAYKDEFNKNVSTKRIGAIIRPLAQIAEGCLPNSKTVRVDGTQMRTVAIREIMKWKDEAEPSCAKEYKRGTGAVAGAPF
jgi:hypothetical protein